MDSAAIETVGCPLDHDLLKSWERFSLESSYNSDCSESTDEETKIKQDECIKLLKDFSFDHVSDSKYKSSECSNKIIEINSQNKNNSETFFIKKNADEENQFFFLLKNGDLLNFVKEADVKSIFSKHLNKDNEANFQKKDDTKKPTFVTNTENDENQLPSLPHKNNELNNFKSDSDSSVGYESDSDDDEQSESVILRERYPKRHNRPENNKPLRSTPFPQNHSKTFKQHLHAKISQASLDTNPVLHNFSILYDNYDSLNNFDNTNFKTHGASSSNGAFHSCFSSSDSVTDDAFESIISSLMTDQIVNGIIPCEVTNQIVNDVIPCKVIDQIVNDVIPCKATDKIINDVIPCTLVEDLFDSVVPSLSDIGNFNGISSAEINNIQCGNNFKEKYFSESGDTSFEVSNIERKTVLDSHFEGLPAGEVEQILKELEELNSDNPLNHSCVNLSEESALHELSVKEVENNSTNFLKFNQDSNVSTFKEINYLNSNQHNFDTEFDYVHSFSLKGNTKEISLHSNLDEGSNILEESSECYNSFVNKPGNYSNLISMNVTSINSECLSPKTSDFMNVSQEIEHTIIKFKEFEWIKKGQGNQSEISDPLPEVGWNMFPFVEVDDNSISDLINKSPTVSTKQNMPGEKNDSKHKNIKQNHKSVCKTEQPKIYWMLRTDARDKLFQSSSFCITKWELEYEEIRRQINSGMLGTEKKKVIHYLNKNRQTKYKGTNLHHAVLSGNIERVFCIVECHKECHETVTEINLRDSFLKTVLDYSKKKGLVLLTDYLRENNATESVSV